MSCAPVTPSMQFLLDTLRGWPVSREVLDEIQAMPEWDQARAWGWIMRTGELTGTGHRHAGPISKGIVHD
jgi:hypothetical protein